MSYRLSHITLSSRLLWCPRGSNIWHHDHKVGSIANTTMQVFFDFKVEIINFILVPTVIVAKVQVCTTNHQLPLICCSSIVGTISNCTNKFYYVDWTCILVIYIIKCQKQILSFQVQNREFRCKIQERSKSQFLIVLNNHIVCAHTL